MPTLSAVNDEYLIVIKLSTREAAKTLSAASREAVIMIPTPVAS